MFVQLMSSSTYIIDLKIYPHTEITTSLGVRYVLNCRDLTDSLVAYAVLFSAKVETLIPPKT
jgi:hypothetical protein